MNHQHTKSFASDLERSKLGVLGSTGNPASLEQRSMLWEYGSQIRHDRGARAEFFERGIFGEPAWDILLALYTIDADRRRLSTGDLAELAGVALTTSLRWLDYLEGHSLIERRSNPFDHRMVYVELADKGRANIDSYLLRIHSADMLPRQESR